jgi:hypothetical protein
MSYWNYRILKLEDPDGNENIYQVHEVYYDDDGTINYWSSDPVSPSGTTTQELREDIQYQLNAFRKPILKEKKNGGSLIPDEEESEINNGHYFEVLDRASVAIDYIYQFLGSHPILKKHENLKEIYDQVEKKLGELYQEIGKLEIENKSK